MSTSESAAPAPASPSSRQPAIASSPHDVPTPSPANPVGLPGVGLLMSEIAMVMRRKRNIVMMIGLALVPVIVGVVLRVANPPTDGDGPPGFLAQVTGNGFFLGFSGLILITPFLWPLVMSVVTGDSIAGEASLGTLRYLLTVPASRFVVLMVKYVTSVVFAFATALLVFVVGAVTGSLLFPSGEVRLLSGTTIGWSETIIRVLQIAGFGAALMAGVAAIGLFISTLTEVPIAAMAATAAVPVVSNILNAIPQLEALHPWLLTDTWMAYGDLLRDPIALEVVNRGLLTQLGYVAVFTSLAWARLTTRDITA